MSTDYRAVLNGVRDKTISVEEALLRLKEVPFEDIDYAKVDIHRKLRQGSAEIIYGEGKTTEQIRGIVEVMQKNGQELIMITRLSRDSFDELKDIRGIKYHEQQGWRLSENSRSLTGSGELLLRPQALVMFRLRKKQ